MRTGRIRDIDVTELGLGLSQLGNLYRETTDEEARGAIDASWDAGVRYFDTAPHYGLGLSERRSGRELSRYPREQFTVSTKVGRLLVADPSGASRRDEEFVVPASHVRVRDFSRDGIRRSIDESLERIGTDHIDIAYLHDPEGFEGEAAAHALPAMVELRAEGTLGAIGVGTKDAQCATFLVENADLDVVMIAGRYTLLDQSAALNLFPAARKAHVAIVAAGVYNSGLLATSRPARDARFEYGAPSAEIYERALHIGKICERFGVTLPEAAIAFCLRNPLVVSVVLGARGLTQAEGNARRFNTPVPDELWDALVSAGYLPSSLSVC